MTGILFDLDGTLIESLSDLVTAVNKTMTHYGYPTKTREEVRMAVGSGVRRLIGDLLPDAEGDYLEQVIETYRIYYAGCCQEQTQPYDGIVEALKQLQKKYPVAIVSNKPDPAVKLLCRQYFGDIYALGENPDCPRKPAPDMLQRAMADIGVDTCIYVGDSDVDVLTAKNAGVPCLSVLWGYRDRACIEAAGGTTFCDDTAKLVEALEAML